MRNISRCTEVLSLRPLAVALVWAGSMTSALATNGMNMEGYGPISTGMGGASQSFDNGTAAMAQNPATLGLMSDGARLDVALGVLGPKITASMAGMPSADSGATSFVMPALGYARRSGALTYGVGMFAQGGMGTEYGANSFMAAGSGEPVRSELGVGKVIIPVAYQVGPDLTLGATFDFMWAGMDMLMAASGAQLGGMVTASSGALGTALPGLAGASWARINFSDGDRNTGAAKATGYSAKLGGVYRVSKDVNIGGSYQFKSRLDDMKTAAGSASMTASSPFSDTGTLTIIDFQWPSVIAVGASWQASPALMVAADVKSIGWADTMKSFRMRYDSTGMGGSVNFSMPQNWKDQTVLSLGMAWKATELLTLRAGVNVADNPIPEDMVNPLFPATIKSHITAGFGYQATQKGAINMSLTMAPRVSVTNSTGVTTTHEQNNVQLMYSHRF